MALVKVEKVAAALDVSPRRVQQLVKEGLPREKYGQYDLGRCMLWFIRYQAKIIARRLTPAEDGSFAGGNKDRNRGWRADAELKEIELAVAKGDLVSIEETERFYSDLVLVTKARILAVPSRVSGDLIGEMSRTVIESKMGKSLKEALAYLAKSFDEDEESAREVAGGAAADLREVPTAS